MNQKHRLMCESWVEKRPEISFVTAYGTSSRKQQSIKWKTRYAMLIVSSESRASEIRFYQKKPRSYTEITDDVVKLQPWQYIVDIPSWIVDKGRPHVLRLRLLPESVIPGQHYRIQIAYQSAEETTAWMRCIQNQTKLTSGIQGHSFGVVAEESSATARIGIAGKHCLLFVSPNKVILAHKTDRSVVCVWPFETIRSFASDDDRRLVIEAGRCAPLGEGVYSFRTRENDDNVIFDLFDHYTAEAAEELEHPKSKNKQHIHTPTTPPEQSKSAPANVSLSFSKSRKAKKKTSKQQQISVEAMSDPGQFVSLEPPMKPPLPENRATMSLVSSHSQSNMVTGSTPVSSNLISFTEVPNNVPEHSQKISPSPSKHDETKQKTSGKAVPKLSSDVAAGRDSMSKGLYDLDKLLYSLESTIHLSQEDLVDGETLGYDHPSPTRIKPNVDLCVKTSRTQEVSPEQKELAYAINTIKSSSGQPPDSANQEKEESAVSTTAEVSIQNEEAKEDTKATSPVSPYDNVQADSFTEAETQKENDKPAKPKIAPKPPSFKLPSVTSKSYKATIVGPKNVPPYAQVDTGKKKVCT